MIAVESEEGVSGNCKGPGDLDLGLQSITFCWSEQITRSAQTQVMEKRTPSLSGRVARYGGHSRQIPQMC